MTRIAMTNAPSGPDSSPNGPDDFGEWLDRIAESKGISRDEVLENLISSYWTLNEMTEMIEQTEDTGDMFAPEVGPDGVLVDRSEFEAFRDGVEDRLEEFGERLAAMEAAADEEGDVTAADLEDRMDGEFRHLRKILEYLLSSVEELEEELDAVDRRLDREVSPLRDERDQLVKLKNLAARLGVEVADCSYCDTTIDLSLLAEPTCLQCGRRFVDIEPRREVLGIGWGVNVLRTADERRGSRGEPDRSSIERRSEGSSRSRSGDPDRVDLDWEFQGDADRRR